MLSICMYESDLLWYGESCAFTITARPTVAITRVTAEIRPDSLSSVATYTTDKSIAANAASSLSYTLQIPAAMNTAMSTTTPMARRRNKVIYVKGAIKLNATLASYAQGALTRTQIGTLPTGILPGDNYQFSIVVEARYIKLIIETDGKMYLMNHCGNAVGASLKISLACSFMED